MGMTRKLLSICSAGLIDYRSDRERIARSSRHTAHALDRQNRLLRQQGRAQVAGSPPMQVAPVQPAPAWLPDPNGQPGLLRWWDGTQWTGSTATVNQT